MKHFFMFIVAAGTFLMPNISIANEWYVLNATATSCIPAATFYNVEEDGFSPDALINGNEELVEGYRDTKNILPVGDVDMY